MRIIYDITECYCLTFKYECYETSLYTHIFATYPSRKYVIIRNDNSLPGCNLQRPNHAHCNAKYALQRRSIHPLLLTALPTSSSNRKGRKCSSVGYHVTVCHAVLPQCYGNTTIDLTDLHNTHVTPARFLLQSSYDG